MNEPNLFYSNEYSGHSTLRVFILFKSSKQSIWGLREAQRKLGFKSPSSMTHHLQKLEDGGFLQKLPNNKWQITMKGLEFQDIRIPTLVSANFMYGIYIPRFSITLSLIGFSILSILSLIIFGVGPEIVVVYSLLTLIGSFGFVLSAWLKSRDQYNKFVNFLNDAN